MVTTFRTDIYHLVTKSSDKMEFELRIVVSERDTNKMLKLLETVERFLNNSFVAKHEYGEAVKKIVIGFLLVKSRPGYEGWYIPKKPKYIEDKIVISSINIQGEEHIIKTFFYQVRPTNQEIEAILASTNRQAIEMINGLIYDSLQNLEALPKKVKDFDKESFKADMRMFFYNGLFDKS